MYISINGYNLLNITISVLKKKKLQLQLQLDRLSIQLINYRNGRY